MSHLELLTQLRAIGVHKFSGIDSQANHYEVEFFRQEPQLEGGSVIPRAMALGMAEEKCPCGHEESAHDNHGLCLLGCPVETCAKKPKDT